MSAMHAHFQCTHLCALLLHQVLVRDIPAISDATAEKLPSIKDLRKSASTRPLVDKDGKAKPVGAER